MSDHFHIVWEINKESKIRDVIINFKKFTARKIIDHLQVMKTEYLDNFISGQRDRDYNIWKNKNGNLRIQGPDILKQKVKYIHNNPTLGNYKSVEQPENYIFSSAKAYHLKSKNFAFLTLLDYKGL